MTATKGNIRETRVSGSMGYAQLEEGNRTIRSQYVVVRDAVKVA